MTQGIIILSPPHSRAIRPPQRRAWPAIPLQELLAHPGRCWHGVQMHRYLPRPWVSEHSPKPPSSEPWLSLSLGSRWYKPAYDRAPLRPARVVVPSPEGSSYSGSGPPHSLSRPADHPTAQLLKLPPHIPSTVGSTCPPPPGAFLGQRPHLLHCPRSPLQGTNVLTMGNEQPAKEKSGPLFSRNMLSGLPAVFSQMRKGEAQGHHATKRRSHGWDLSVQGWWPEPSSTRNHIPGCSRGPCFPVPH